MELLGRVTYSPWGCLDIQCPALPGILFVSPHDAEKLAEPRQARGATAGQREASRDGPEITAAGTRGSASKPCLEGAGSAFERLNLPFLGRQDWMDVGSNVAVSARIGVHL